MKARRLILAILLGAAVSATAQSGRCGNYANWTFKNGTLTISGSGVIVRPGHGDSGNGDSHDSSENYDKYWKNATKVIIEPGITSTGKFAFYECNNLKEVSISNTVKEIGRCTFDRTGLTSIVIPNSVTVIGESAFAVCDNLRSITIPNSVTTLGTYAFSSCKSLNSITIPSSVTSIEKSAFSSCENLSSVFFEESSALTYISESTFNGCNNLVSINLPTSVKNIGKTAFTGCYSLSSLVLPNSLEEMSLDAFGTISEPSCIALKELIVPDKPIRFYCDYGGTKFYGIPNVENVRGHNNLYPVYFFDHLLESTPFMVSFAKKRKTSSYFAYKEIYPQIQQWQHQM